MFCPLLQVDCPPGYYAALGGKEIMTCTPCAVGYYQTDAGKTTCDSCPKGFTTLNTGSNKVAECKGILCELLIKTKRTS